MRYHVVADKRVMKDLRRIPRMVLKRIEEAMRSLADMPFPEQCKKLHNYPNGYRVRVGDDRIIYEVADEIRIVTVVRVGHRSRVYQLL